MTSVIDPNSGTNAAIVAMFEKLGDVLLQPSTPRPIRMFTRRLGAYQNDRAPLRQDSSVATFVERRFLQADATRRVARATMARTLDQIGTAIPRRIVVQA